MAVEIPPKCRGAPIVGFRTDMQYHYTPPTLLSIRQTYYANTSDGNGIADSSAISAFLHQQQNMHYPAILIRQ